MLRSVLFTEVQEFRDAGGIHWLRSEHRGTLRCILRIIALQPWAVEKLEQACSFSPVRA